MIRIENLRVGYGKPESENLIIKDLNLSIEKNESLSIIGPSGCGKTTLLHTLAGLQEKCGGEIVFSEEVRNQALILQEIGLLPWKTVWGNAVLGLEIQKDTAHRRAGELLDQLDLHHLRDKYPKHLSGGQKRRLGLVRALAVNPSVLYMDEPLVSLDEFTRENLQDVILELWKERELTMVMVTHNVGEAVYLGERIAVLSKMPTSAKMVIDNEKFGSSDYRGTEDFYRKIEQLRELL